MHWAPASDDCDLLCDVMTRALSLPDADHEQFDNPPLKVMLGQVRFPAILKLADPAGLAAFQDEIRSEYSEYGVEQQLNLAVGPEGMSTAGEAKNYKFSTSDGAWSVVVNPMFVTLEASVATRYSNYEEFSDRFGRIWEAALRLLGPTKSQQQGLRYIDFFDWPDVAPSEWGRYLNPYLLGLLGAEEIVNNVEHTLTDARLKLTDDIAIAFKYGLVRSGPENALGFLMDTDCLSQTPQDDVTTEAILKRFNDFHEEIHRLFHWCLTPEAIERFRVGSARSN
ncbi:MAG: TIGR04255 family protein [Chloroflexi bacterium]|nr:MAG: TIGR04255 family protein [Chloroflexota bacterium]